MTILILWTDSEEKFSYGSKSHLIVPVVWTQVPVDKTRVRKYLVL